MQVRVDFYAGGRQGFWSVGGAGRICRLADAQSCSAIRGASRLKIHTANTQMTT
jgi:hypothetical protein